MKNQKFSLLVAYESTSQRTIRYLCLVIRLVKPGRATKKIYNLIAIESSTTAVDLYMFMYFLIYINKRELCRKSWHSLEK